ncbi:hypothetical protein H7I53_06800 [Mycolicibacterium pulveris]|uniref:Uncharacterized protein n=1 Tax=Mycolicibacterium pulveris TaxID=36813 RepID=A0A7I7UJ85_MYCPV|nr:hypothetical protein [Mycolicibacterium pulveris]MCV6979935.1 hypothetical protein [Mycolicibacterium pulveris]BBY81307.1 hypothetical protein MPUL_24650 [Mycolicibacterium pulveris]
MDPLDELYAAPLEDFTAVRAELVAAAKKRGATDEAKRISAARKPTTAAWVVNRLAHADDAVPRRLTDLGARLREAHAETDGARIRELTAEQRRLIDDLTRAAFEEAELPKPSASLRDDVTATLQAAVADPDVAARIGRLTKAEQWSGFGGFGDSAAVFTPKTEPKPAKRDKPAATEDRRERDEARAELAAAERAKAEADEALAELQSDLATARLRHHDARRRLDEAEAALAAAEDAYDKGKQASREAAQRVRRANRR